MRLYQPGFDDFEPIVVNLRQDGTFKSQLFDGDYQLAFTAGIPPWVKVADTLNFSVNGATTLDVPIDPYYGLRSVKYEIDGELLKASATVYQRVFGKNIEKVSLYTGNNVFLDNTLFIGPASTESSIPGNKINDFPAIVNLAQSITAVKSDYFYARIGIKLVGIPEQLFTPVMKIQK